MRPGQCGNDPRTQLTPGDLEAVDEFKAYLAERARVAAGQRVKAAAEEDSTHESN